MLYNDLVKFLWGVCPFLKKWAGESKKVGEIKKYSNNFSRCNH
jgi:hypothetical protein